MKAKFKIGLKIIFILCIWLFSLSSIVFAFLGARYIPKIVGESQEKDEEQKNSIIRPKITYEGERYRNPFSSFILNEQDEQETETQIFPTVTSDEIESEITPPSLEVQGVVWGGRFPQAIINNQVFQEGEMIGDARIIKIDQKGIEVVFKGKQFKYPSPGLSDTSHK